MNKFSSQKEFDLHFDEEDQNVINENVEYLDCKVFHKLSIYENFYQILSFAFISYKHDGEYNVKYCKHIESIARRMIKINYHLKYIDKFDLKFSRVTFDTFKNKFQKRLHEIISKIEEQNMIPNQIV